ncbi:MAG: DUF3370 domain-containing protein [Leptolyngbyaceae bacterium]|nr:DUF3370 domain-containing protein [Leptolyngbyaceae bacterium]
MLTVLSFVALAQVALPIPPPPAPLSSPQSMPRQIIESQDVRPLSGGLNTIPVFNSNSPELIQSDGILLSTFPANGMDVPSAHLNYPLEGRFDIFAHHIARGIDADDNRTLYLGILAYNPTRQPIEISSSQGATYLGQDAPYLDLPSYVANPLGTVYSGPGSRTVNDVLRGQRHSYLPESVVIPPRQPVMLLNVPIPLRRLTVPTNGTWLGGRVIPVPPPPEPEEPLEEENGDETNGDSDKPPRESPPLPIPDNRPIPSNGRSVLMSLESSGPVYVASLAMYAPKTPDGNERVPTLREWVQLLREGNLAGPRDIAPTPPDASVVSRFFYGRVAGVAQGTEWAANLTDTPESSDLTIPSPGEQFSYVISSVDRNTFGTGQIQSAPMLARYRDTAYRAHGNYGIKYSLTLPLHNPTDQLQTVSVLFQTPLQNERLDEGLSFLSPPANRIFFRGTVRLEYEDDWRIRQTRYFHIVHRQGQQGQPLIRLRMLPGDRRQVKFDLIYPPDATPPQALTIRTEPLGDR